ncbi:MULTISPECIES: uracil-DNA glycosylase [Thalassospira]|jgi:DNA polymerase|uniref:uracil-DNA glycosylase n=1 Tax=Thalassospira TaxID=168934 RepID=UPI00080FC86E|nr:MULTISPECIES: uracil-DNA glycosylase [Thalassospira]MAB35300.1 uracil-DNA glycosylase [Thalassospira sp.]MBA06045.1 uracil-DNA glycosylase [Thalassospira sp.]MDM7974694.1 uracil-DNA glycosylase [Thalassospira xiamenensis]OCK06282.1 phage SPO1 DNA polymerase-related protein [Thalassospira sp. KO164]OHZ02235.1 uracil-DNA glycosylase [Thalassospira sp. MIT1004]|tara:strand:- start:1469 stop:2362 length:894 start_codon:yes stop_codon:yes gene_type:complete
MSKPITDFDVNNLDPLQALIWQFEMGADEAIADEPLDRFKASESLSRQAAGQPGRASLPPNGGAAARPAMPRPAGGATPMTPPPPMPPGAGFLLSDTPHEARQSARDLAAAATNLADLKEAVEKFEGCALKKSASNTVFGVGNPEARLVLVGEAPGAEEDRQGEPFVGPSGKLLDAMLRSIGFAREEVYITNILPWRPPGNRQPTTAEIAVCEPFVRRHLELIGPKVVICLGGSAAKTLMEEDRGITRLRGTWKEMALGAASVADVTAMFHPAYLLRTPEQKRMAWRDLRAVAQKLS